MSFLILRDGKVIFDGDVRQLAHTDEYIGNIFRRKLVISVIEAALLHISQCHHHSSYFPPCLLHVFGSKERGTQLDQLAVGVDVEVVFDAHADIFFRNIDSRLDRERHARAERNVVIPAIVHIQANVVAQPVNEILIQRLPVQIFAVRLDVVAGNFVERILGIRRVSMVDLPDWNAAMAASCAPSTMS